VRACAADANLFHVQLSAIVSWLFKQRRYIKTGH
jgi:hypothetical protein